MRSPLRNAVPPTIQINRNELRRDEETFASVFAEIARLLWPAPKTAARVAAACGCSERNAELWLSGKQKWSGDAIAAITTEIMVRHKARNIKIIAR